MTWWKNAQYDLKGQKFVRLTVISAASISGPRYWWCACSCGTKRHKVSANNLKKAAVVSCGCALKGCNIKRPYEWLYNTIPKARRQLTFEEFVTLTRQSGCHYYTQPILWRRHAGQGTRSYNLDRKEHSKGYAMDNVVVCCKRCNFTRGDRFTYQEFVKIGRLIRRLDASR